MTLKSRHSLAGVHVEAGVEEGTVAQGLVRVLLQDLPEVQLAAGVDILLVGAVALLPRAVPAILLHLRTWRTQTHAVKIDTGNSGDTLTRYKTSPE